MQYVSFTQRHISYLLITAQYYSLNVADVVGSLFTVATHFRSYLLLTLVEASLPWSLVVSDLA